MRRKILREKERLEKTGLSRTTWWRLENSGQAPERVHLTESTVGWFEDEIDTWLEERAAKRGRRVLPGKEPQTEDQQGITLKRVLA